DRVADPPDLIHGQHHVETMTALLRFPDAPAVFFCHGWLPWEEQPPRFPRILRYVAVDEACRDRLITESGVPPARVDVIPNFIDLQRSRPPDGLPGWPRRAAVFSNYATEQNYLPAVRQACSQAGLQLDVIGSGSGHPVAAPEEVLPHYDLVFAKG